MLTATLLTVMAGVPTAASGATLSPAYSILLNAPGGLAARKRDRQEIRSSYRQALRHANSRHNPDPFAVTPELLTLYWELNNPKSMPPTERGRMRRALKGRLEVMRDKLLRVRLKVQRELQRKRLRTRTARTARARRKPASRPGGGGVFARASQLIGLIQNTIAPESWMVNGGRGTISFLGAPIYALVIRNTAEVHHQIGGR